MAFFSLDPALEESVASRSDAPVIVIEVADDSGSYIRLPVDAVKEAWMRSYRDSLGGYCAYGRLLFKDAGNLLSGLSGKDREIQVYFSSGDCGLYLHRFTLQVRDMGFIRRKVGGVIWITTYVEDAPSRIKRLGALRNWQEKQTVTDLVMSDKSVPSSSLLHLIAARGGVTFQEIDCSTISLTLVYASLSGNPWNELCALASSCRAIIEGGVDFKLLFSGSPYQSDEEAEEIPALPADLFHSLSEEDAGELHWNSVRLKWNRPERLANQLLWSYEDAPVVYDEAMIPSWPFLPDGDRAIQDEEVSYEAHFEVREEYKRLPVIWADEVQSLEDVEAALVYEAADESEGGLTVTSYLAERQRALVNVVCGSAGSLFNLSISGRPIVMRSGTACYLSDDEDIAERGLRIRSGDSPYFSDDVVGSDSLSHPEDWVSRELAEGVNRGRRFRGRSEFSLFYVKAGSRCTLIRETEEVACRVEELVLDYKRSLGMECRVVLLEESEEGGTDGE